MDTWSIAQLAVDFLFALLMAGAVAGFLYHRERKLKHMLAGILTQSSTTETAAPAKSESGAQAIKNESGSKINRAEKYLEAVRMYRNGRDKKEIEKRLGISLVELELLGRAK